MANSGIKTTLGWVIGISSIALVLLVLLIIFGNLSGNMGIITTRAETTINESGGIGPTGYTPSGVSGVGFMSYAVNQVWGNYSSGTPQFIIPASNYTQTGNVIYNNSGALNLVVYGYDDAGITYTTTYRSGEYNQAEALITNYTSGVGKLTSQIPTILLFVGIALLLFVLIGVLAWVIKKMSSFGGDGSFGREGNVE